MPTRPIGAEDAERAVTLAAALDRGDVGAVRMAAAYLKNLAYRIRHQLQHASPRPPEPRVVHPHPRGASDGR